MATVNLLSGEVMDFAAARLNDASRQIYTYTRQLPFLNIALAELQEIYQANNIPVTDQTSTVIDVDSAASGFVEVTFEPDTPPVPAPDYLPDDLLEIKVLWESPRGLNQWTPVNRVDTLPQYQIGQQINQFLIYQWATNAIKLLASNADNDLKIDYIRSLFTAVADENTDLLVQNSLTFLGNRTASLVASDIEENQERANRLYGDALGGLDRSLTIPTKGRQRITIRRRPFRGRYKAGNRLS